MFKMYEFQKRFFLYLILIFNFIDVTLSCPSYCTCKWKNGKQTVECQKKNLTNIPKSLDPGTQVLDLSHNNLQFLSNECFAKLGLINLQKIFLPNCRISKIHNDAFKELSNLVELDLSHNFISAIPSSTFQHYPSLMRLCLNENPIKVIKRQAFHPLTLLTSLEMSNCDVIVVEIDAFVGLVSLEWLKLDGNKLETIQGANLFPDSLHGIDLQNNIWKCDCKLEALHHWLVNFHAPNTIEPECTSPQRMKGDLIKSVKESDLACLPDVSPTSFDIELNEHDNISLQCFVNATPQAQVSWWFQGQMLFNNTVIEPGLRVHFYEEEGTFNKKSELNIFNVNSRDNGTFECIAENAAGRNQGNFTLRVIIKQKPEATPPEFSFRCKALLISVSTLLVVIVFLVVLVSVLKCKRAKEQRKQNDLNKVIHEENSSKASTLNSLVSIIPPKSFISCQNNDQNDNLSINSNSTNHQVSLINFDRTIYFSPTIGQFNTEKNPDLITDTETTVKGNKCLNVYPNENNYRYPNWPPNNHNPHSIIMMTKPNVQYLKTNHQQPTYSTSIATLPRGISINARKNNVYVAPGLAENNGYPNDFGLPKIVKSQKSIPYAQSGVNMYNTLPYKRVNTKCEWTGQGMLMRTTEEVLPEVSAPQNLIPKEIKFSLDGNVHVMPNYMAEPCIVTPSSEFIPSPPEGYKSDILPSNSHSLKECVPHCKNCSTDILGVTDASSNRISSSTFLSNKSEHDRSSTSLSDRNADTSRAPCQMPNIKCIFEQCTESPDEGYVGDNTDNTGI